MSERKKELKKGFNDNRQFEAEENAIFNAIYNAAWVCEINLFQERPRRQNTCRPNQFFSFNLTAIKSNPF